ncbi:MAG: hypothetical protein R3A13_02200 [Bdellovibrionota bacterium]
MNKRTILSFISVFIFIFIFEWLVHGELMKGMYTATSSLWRPESEMQNYCSWMMLGQAIFAFMFVRIFAYNYENKGVAEGYRYGALVGLLMAGPTVASYAYMPVPMSLILCWVIIMVIEGILAGMLTAKVYASVG